MLQQLPDNDAVKLLHLVIFRQLCVGLLHQLHLSLQAGQVLIESGGLQNKQQSFHISTEQLEKL